MIKKNSEQIMALARDIRVCLSNQSQSSKYANYLVKSVSHILEEISNELSNKEAEITILLVWSYSDKYVSVGVHPCPLFREPKVIRRICSKVARKKRWWKNISYPKDMLHEVGQILDEVGGLKCSYNDIPLTGYSLRIEL